MNKSRNIDLEYVYCDLCEKDEYTNIATQTDIIHNSTTDYFNIVQCNNCGLNYTNPRPKKESIHQYYVSEYSFHAKLNKVRLRIIFLLTKVANSKFGWLINLIPLGHRRKIELIQPQINDPVMEHIRTKTNEIDLIDIGCGSGISAHYWGINGSLNAYKKFANVIAIEIDDDAREILLSNNITAYKSIEELANNNQFDIIRLNWSLEHIFSPTKYFSFIKKRLKNDGIAIITVPNYDGLIYRLDKTCVELPIHLYHFNESSIQKYANKNNLIILSFSTFSYPAMFCFAGEIGIDTFKKMDNMTYNEARSFQGILNILSNSGLGNDMMIILNKS